MSSDDTPPQSTLPAAKAALVDVLSDELGDNLRDVWVLDQQTQEPLYLREDVADRVEDIDVEKYLDNERYGFVTRETYNLLHYSEFRYTHRGFDTWELFRTFIVDGPQKVGVLVGLDTNGKTYHFGDLTEAIHDIGDEHGVDSLAPAADDA
jgi:hypothetical protein